VIVLLLGPEPNGCREFIPAVNADCWYEVLSCGLPPGG
jgi:hypothetical protein